MRAVFDTNILIDYLNGVELARDEIQRYTKTAISVITYIEIQIGIAHKKQLDSVKSFLRHFQIMDVTGEIADLAISVRRAHKLKIPDAIILATAQFFKGDLVTRNTKDFTPDFPSVRVPYQL